eukprot:15271422-Heterocapsa_arctica.AAC.1
MHVSASTSGFQSEQVRQCASEPSRLLVRGRVLTHVDIDRRNVITRAQTEQQGLQEHRRRPRVFKRPKSLALVRLPDERESDTQCLLAALFGVDTDHEVQGVPKLIYQIFP